MSARLVCIAAALLLLSACEPPHNYPIPKPVTRFVSGQVTYLRIHEAVVREDYFVSMQGTSTDCVITIADPNLNAGIAVNSTIAGGHANASAYQRIYIFGISGCPSMPGEAA